MRVKKSVIPTTPRQDGAAKVQTPAAPPLSKTEKTTPAKEPAHEQAASFAADGETTAHEMQAKQQGPLAGSASPMMLRIEAGTGQIDSRLKITAEETAAYEARNAKTARGKYPTLEKVLQDPDAFVQDMRGRFAAQKAKTPDTPYLFDVGDYATPVLKQMSEGLDAEIALLTKELKDLKAEGQMLPDFLSRKDEMRRDLQLGIDHCKALKAEVSGHADKGELSYRRMQELSYHVSQALGVFDYDDLNLRDRGFLLIDQYLMGVETPNIQELVRRYEANEFTVFQKDPNVEGFKMVQKPFEDAFLNTEEMEMVVLPTMEHLGPAPFMRLSSYDLFLVGVAADPVAADGFVRPGGDFWTHDIRHSSSIFGRRKMYEVEHQMSEPQVRKMQKKIDVWRAELDEARKAIPDKELRYAIGFFMFNYHHDRGYPMVPSSYKMDDVDHVSKLLYMMLKVSDQKIGFENPTKTLKKAYGWLREFWMDKLPEEQAILGAESLGAFVEKNGGKMPTLDET
jgi:hypothetical protein